MPKLKSNKSLKKRLIIKKNKVMFPSTSKRHNNLKKGKKFLRNARKNKTLHASAHKRMNQFISQF